MNCVDLPPGRAACPSTSKGKESNKTKNLTHDKRKANQKNSKKRERCVEEVYKDEKKKAKKKVKRNKKKAKRASLNNDSEQRDVAAALVMKGNEAINRADMTAAMESFRSAIEASPGTVEAHYKLAIIMQREISSGEELKEIEEHLSSALRNSSAGCSKEESGFALQALHMMGMMLCQAGREEEARKVLRALGFDYRLSPHVLHYPVISGPPSSSASSASAQGSRSQVDDGSGAYVKVIDGVLPRKMFEYMHTAFREDGPFWAEHSYFDSVNPPGYFSYTHSLTTPLPANGSDSATTEMAGIDQVLHYLWEVAKKHCPQVKRARYSEWWAHCRPHSSGHQLHFDSDDEGKKGKSGSKKGAIHNPIISSVLYLDARVGGPTVMTNQVLGGKLADKGWLVFPKENRYVMFHGDVLHGVTPGRGVSPVPGGKRISFMCAFWEEIEIHPPAGKPGASQPFPSEDAERYTWTRLLRDVDVLGDRRTTEQRDGSAGKDENQRRGHAYDSKLKKGKGKRKRTREDQDRGGAWWYNTWGSSSPIRALPLSVESVWDKVEDEYEDEFGPPPVRLLDSLPSYDVCFQGF